MVTEEVAPTAVELAMKVAGVLMQLSRTSTVVTLESHPALVAAVFVAVVGATPASRASQQTLI